MSDDNSSSRATSAPLSQVQVDAAHPLFLEPSQKSVSCSTSNSWKYQCTQCNERLINKDAYLKKHFLNTQHKAVAECHKCKGNIFEYLDHNTRALYHKCRKKDVEVVHREDMNQNYMRSDLKSSATGEE